MAHLFIAAFFPKYKGVFFVVWYSISPVYILLTFLFTEVMCFTITDQQTSSLFKDFFSCRSIVWIQAQRDKQLEQMKGSTPRKDETHEYRVGRLKQEKVSIPRGDNVRIKNNSIGVLALKIFILVIRLVRDSVTQSCS